jgi:hypothetical protein
MHKSPAYGQLESLPQAAPTRTRGLFGWGMARFALTLTLAATCLCRFPAFTQGSQQPTDVATQGQQDEQPSDAPSSANLSDEVIKDVLSDFQRGFETHNLDKVLSVFDATAMPDFAQFRDQMVAYFRLHESFKLRYQLLQVTADDGLGMATADIEMDDDPLDTLPTPKRRSTQMRFQIKRTPKGWRIIGLGPMEFFGA